jgi:hypothetical protein
MADKITITETIETITCSEFHRPVTELIVMMDDLVQKYGPDVYLDYERDFHYPYDEYSTPVYHLQRRRLETDEEYEVRIKYETLREQQQRERDELQFEMLKRRLGK